MVLTLSSLVYEQGWCPPVLGLLPRSRPLRKSETRPLEGEQSSKVALSACPPKLNLHKPFNSAMTCEYLHCSRPDYTERSASLSNQHFIQGENNATRSPHLTGSLTFQYPVIYSQRDCPLGL